MPLVEHHGALHQMVVVVEEVVLGQALEAVEELIMAMKLEEVDSSIDWEPLVEVAIVEMEMDITHW